MRRSQKEIARQPRMKLQAEERLVDEGLGSELEHMRDCLCDPAHKNEAYHLELPSIGEWPGNLWSSGCSEEGDP
jgi:hypothetical protein